MALHIQSTQDTANTSSPFSLSAVNTAVAMDDFNRDGFEDLFIMSNAELLVATAVDINNRNEGMAFGPTTALTSASLAAISDPATGDFNGDGLIDVAWIDEAQIVRFATVCPGDIAGTVCANKSALEIVLNPLQAGSTNINIPNVGDQCLSDGYGDVALTAGDYRGNGSDGLIGIRMVELSAFNCAYFAYWYEFSGNFSVASSTYRDRVQLALEVDNIVINTYAQSSALNWSGSEQAVVALGAADSGGNFVEILTVFTFDANTMTPHTKLIDSGMTSSECQNSIECPWINGLALGRFAAISDAQDSNAEFDLQIATLRNDGKVTIFTVQPPMGNTPADWTPQEKSQTQLETSLGLAPRTDNTNGFSWLVAGDLQGRSAHLGPPSIVRISQHMEPSVILGHPPMHADYILPDESTATMTQTVNLSVVPNTYYAQYQTQVQSSNQSSHTDTTSHSYGFAESATEKVKFNIPLVSSLSGSFTQAWQQQSTHISATNNYSYRSQSFDSSTNTGFGDQIWFTEYDFNIYFYPVLGQTVCPNDNPNCSPSEEQPLYVSYSGPSSISRNSVSGSHGRVVPACP